MFMCVVNLKSVNKLDLTWKQSFLIITTNITKNIVIVKSVQVPRARGSLYGTQLVRINCVPLQWRPL